MHPHGTPTTIRCPKCSGEMRTFERGTVHVEQCVDCRGIFLDRGELERLLDLEAETVAAVQAAQARAAMAGGPAAAPGAPGAPPPGWAPGTSDPAWARDAGTPDPAWARDAGWDRRSAPPPGWHPSERRWRDDDDDDDDRWDRDRDRDRGRGRRRGGFLGDLFDGLGD